MARSIEFDITANDKATGTLRGVKDAIGQLSDRMGTFFTVSTLLDRALGLVQQGFQFIAQTLKDTAALNDQAKAAGLTTDEFQRLGIAAAEAGLNQEGLMRGLKLTKEFLRDARAEGSKQAQVLLALGYSQEQVTSGNIDAMDAMMRVSGAVEAATSSQEKYNVAASVFGARAQELMPLLDGLRNAIASAASEPIVSQSSIDNLDKADKKIDRLIRLLKTATAEGANFMLSGGGPMAFGLTTPTMGLTYGSAMFTQFGEKQAQPSIPVTEKDKAAAAALGKLGITAATGGGAAGMGNVSAAQSLGMATSIALAQQQTAYLATIAANTSPQSGGAIPGRTNFTKPADATSEELNVAYRNIRYTTAPSTRMARPAR